MESGDREHRRAGDAAQIVLLGVGAAVVFGVLHNQVTVRISPEFFTRGHPNIFPFTSPAVLALAWGVLRPLVSGLIVSIPAAALATAGRRPQLSARDMRAPILALCLAMATGSVLGGIAGYRSAANSSREPPAEGVRYRAVEGAHRAAHATGAAGAVALWIHTLRRRRHDVRS